MFYILTQVAVDFSMYFGIYTLDGHILLYKSNLCEAQLRKEGGRSLRKGSSSDIVGAHLISVE